MTLLRMVLPFAVVVFMAIVPRYLAQMVLRQHNTVVLGTALACVNVALMSAALLQLLGTLAGVVAFGAGGASVVLRLWDAHFHSPWMLEVRRARQ